MSKQILIDPIAKPRMVKSDSWKKRPTVLRYWAYKDELQLKCKLKNISITDQLHCEFIIKMPKSWSNKKKELMNGKPHKSKPDCDNMIKAVNDCLLIDDSAIYKISASKYWGHTGSIIFFENNLHLNNR